MHAIFLVSAMASAVSCVLNLFLALAGGDANIPVVLGYYASRTKAKAAVVQNNVFELKIESRFRATALFRPLNHTFRE